MIFIRNLKFCYTLNAEYSGDITHHNFSFMFSPHDTNRQRIENLNIEIADCPKLNITRDNFKNKRYYGLIDKPHNKFSIKVTGNALTGLDIYEEYTSEPVEYSLLKVQTSLTLPGLKLREYHNGMELDKLENDYEKALHIMHTIYYTFNYASGATVVHSSAEEALRLGMGVCQDYAHIMLSVLRMENIPCRYVVGMMLGEGASHAWAEVLCNGYWYGFDPTNNKLVNDEYIRVSAGRDSSDCSVIRGNFYGLANQRQKEIVSVEDISN